MKYVPAILCLAALFCVIFLSNVHASAEVISNWEAVTIKATPNGTRDYTFKEVTVHAESGGSGWNTYLEKITVFHNGK